MYWPSEPYCHLESSLQMMKAENSVQLHEAKIQEELHKDNSEDSDMADTGAEEHPD